VRALDLPSEPEEPGRAERPAEGGTDRGRVRETPDPDERGRVYEAMRAHVSVDTGGAAEPARRPDGADRRSYWDEVPRFLDMWADHEKRWPERQHATEPGCPADPAGSYRSRGGLELNPARHAETVEAISRMRKAEPAISADIQTIAKENTYGGWLEGFDRRIKGDDRLKEKIAAQVAAESDKASSVILQKIPDAVRFTLCFEPASYTQGYYDIKARLEDRGHEVYQSTNYWADSEYKGINTRWATQEGQRFEVQFHTPESFHAKQYVTHIAYERLRDPQIADEERRDLEDFQREVSSHIRTPNSAADIPDFKKEGF